MRNDAIELEESRLRGIDSLKNYPWYKDRHRVFPQVFENRRHKKILDISAGVGCTARNISAAYPAELLCNDISPTCLRVMERSGLRTVSFDIDKRDTAFPFPDGSFDAVISLVTIEHLMNPDHFLRETQRILQDKGFLYISTPNYAALSYLLKLLLSGRTFHDPIHESYEFYAHVRYYTYRTLLEFVSSFGFGIDAVYVAKMKSGDQYRQMRSKSKVKAYLNRSGRWLMYHLLPPRWTAEPILCFQKNKGTAKRRIRKVVL
jgi:ubiquinone/menaquinone biosynthesis C-methylase UbiE